ncbi:hypothetical protein KORDIASMS9_01222 [Kordia sp. SMS9]|uniref:hypothetical protein n=1 Tax=Kordia sp. SMS9 TaxID=2282170 RepID=UPI000E0D3BB6|nr:hypothetical protein [Kordia sp. SMS9]AXG69003.1 hypothetical protein KORDIASMS9_01222 [Kordia sp. SMS9]
MQLNYIQIQELYKFTREQKVKHFDLQTELVDHLANGIEKQWKENPTCTFQEILALEFEKFGPDGFKKVIEKHDVILDKKYKKLLIRFALEYLKLPKIIGTIAGIFILVYLQQYEEYFKGWGIIFFVFMLIPYIFLASFQLELQYKRKVKKTKKCWKLEEMIFNSAYGFTIILFFIQSIYNFDLHEIDSIYIQLLIAILMMCCLIFTYIVFIVLPDKASELLRETYPEYELLA